MFKATKKFVLPLSVLALSVNTAAADCSKATLPGSTANVFERLDAVTACLAELKEESAALRNAVLISTKPCDTLGSDWRTYTPANGRFVIGADGSYAAQSTGGKATVKLDVQHMPGHTHKVVGLNGPSEWGFDSHGNSHALRFSAQDGPPWANRTGGLEAQTTGGSLPHDNMPPYIAMHLCKKG